MKQDYYQADIEGDETERPSYPSSKISPKKSRFYITSTALLFTLASVLVFLSFSLKQSSLRPEKSLLFQTVEDDHVGGSGDMPSSGSSNGSTLESHQLTKEENFAIPIDSPILQDTGDRVFVLYDQINLGGTSCEKIYNVGPQLTENFTIGMYITTTKVSVRLMTLNRTPTNFNNEFVFELDSNGKVQFWDAKTINSFGFNVLSDKAVNTGRKTHVAVVRSGLTATIYIDGRPAGTSTSTVSVTYGTSILALGCDYRDKLAYFQGSIERVAIYSAAFTKFEILRTLIMRTNDTSLLYTFGNTLLYFDDSSYNYNVDLPNTITGFTFSLWLVPFSYDVFLLSLNWNRVNVKNSFIIYIDYGGHLAFAEYSDAGINTFLAISSFTIDLKSWVHIAVSKVGTNIHFYRNGILTDTFTSSVIVNYGTSDLTFGRNIRSWSNTFNGYTCNLRLISLPITSDNMILTNSDFNSNIALPNTITSFTFSAWLQSFSDNFLLSLNWNSTNTKNSFIIKTSFDRLLFTDYTDAGTAGFSVMSSFTVDRGKWTHVSISKTNGRVLFYKNGILIDTFVSTADVTYGTKNLTFGVNNRDSTRAFNGNKCGVNFNSLTATTSGIQTVYRYEIDDAIQSYNSNPFFGVK